MKTQWHPMKDVPMDGTPVLLFLEKEMLGSQIHVGVFRNNYRLISCRFYFECPEPLAWSPLPKLSTREVISSIVTEEQNG